MSLDVPKTPGLVTIRYIVMSILNRMEDYTMKKYKRLVQIAIEGYGVLLMSALDFIKNMQFNDYDAATFFKD